MNIPWTLKPFDIDSLFNPSLTLTSCALCDESCFAPTKSKHITYCEACIEFMESDEYDPDAEHQAHIECI